MFHVTMRALKYCSGLVGCAAIAVCAVQVTKSAAQGQSSTGNASPIYGVTIPAGYRDWKVISAGRLVAGGGNQLRIQLGNDIAIKAFQEGKRPFPDGSIVAALHWKEVSSEDNTIVIAATFPGTQSFVVGDPLNAQFMVKDSKKYAATAGWGWADFKDGKPGDEALHQTYFACHAPAKAQDYVFAHYAGTPGL